MYVRTYVGMYVGTSACIRSRVSYPAEGGSESGLTNFGLGAARTEGS